MYRNRSLQRFEYSRSAVLLVVIFSEFSVLNIGLNFIIRMDVAMIPTSPVFFCLFLYRTLEHALRLALNIQTHTTVKNDGAE